MHNFIASLHVPKRKVLRRFYNRPALHRRRDFNYASCLVNVCIYGNFVSTCKTNHRAEFGELIRCELPKKGLDLVFFCSHHVWLLSVFPISLNVSHTAFLIFKNIDQKTWIKSSNKQANSNLVHSSI